MIQRKLVPAVAIFLLAINCACGQTAKIAAVENNLTENREIIFADSIVPKYKLQERMKFYKVPSVSIALIENGKIQWTKAYGYADLDGKRLATTMTIYQAASVSKSVNALGIIKLAQMGKLSLEKDIRNYLITWVFPDNEFSAGKTITLKNLLSHTAGLSTNGFIGYSQTDTIPTINQILDGQRPATNEAVRPIVEAGTISKYSGGGTTITRKILDDNISANYDSILQGTVLQPLKMINSTFSQPLSNHYTNYAFAYDKYRQVLKGNYNVYPEQAPDGLWTTPSDLANFIIAIQRSIKDSNNGFLTREEAMTMLTPVLKNSDAALGTFIQEKNGEKYFTHSGANYGYRSTYYGGFTNGRGIVILTNSDNGQALIDEIINSVATVYDWKGFYNPLVKKLVAVPDTLLDKYAGEYYSENPKMKISIIKNYSGLELTARRPEKMYATAANTFFLASSPKGSCVFSSSGNNGIIDKFEVLEGTTVVITATRTPI